VKSTQKNSSVRQPKGSLHHFLQQAFIPCRTNQYRPHLIRRYGILGILVFVIAVQALNFSTVNATASTSSTTDDVLLTVTNNEREKRQLEPLVMSDKLSRAAAFKARDMLTHQYWAHIAPDGSTPWKWFNQVGYSYSYAGENLAKNFRTPEAIMAAWMASPEHQANILDAHYSEAGFATVNGTLGGKQVRLTVALYGTPSLAGIPGTASTVGTSTPVGQQMSMMERLNLAAQALSLTSLLSILLLLIGAIVALIAHMYRKKLPKKLRASSYRHHGLLKAGGMLSLCFIIVFLYTGGQI